MISSNICIVVQMEKPDIHEIYYKNIKSNNFVHPKGNRRKRYLKKKKKKKS